MRRGKSTKKNEENEEVGSILHSAKSPNLSWQRIYAQGFRPRRLFVHDQGGKGTGHAKPVLVGPGDNPQECAQSVQVAAAMSVAIGAVREGEEAADSQMVPQTQVNQMLQTQQQQLNK